MSKQDTQDARAFVAWDWCSSNCHLWVSVGLPGLIRGEECDRFSGLGVESVKSYWAREKDCPFVLIEIGIPQHWV